MISLYSWEGLRPQDNARNMHLQDLVILPNYRDTGIGDKLMRVALDSIKDGHIAKVTLVCEESLV